jgi:hypothetical protein
MDWRILGAVTDLVELTKRTNLKHLKALDEEKLKRRWHASTTCLRYPTLTRYLEWNKKKLVDPKRALKIPPDDGSGRTPGTADGANDRRPAAVRTKFKPRINCGGTGDQQEGNVPKRIKKQRGK